MLLSLLASIALTGAAYAMILYLSAVGLSVTMGLLGIANLAHGAFAMAGGYLLILLLVTHHVPFGVALAAACIGVGALSFLLERLLYARFYAAGELDQVAMSIGLIFMSIAIARYLFGPLSLSAPAPELLSGQLDLGPAGAFPLYRLFLIGVGVLVFALLWLGIERTLVGARIRATVDNRVMAEAVGVHTKRLFSIVFVLGSMLAALGGALGGLGSVSGPFLAALLLGVGDTACRILVPQIGAFFVYIALFLILLLRPAGLFGRA
jgi:branched-chain amino acid transport system permease protein